MLDSEVERISKQTGMSSLSFAAKASSNGIYRYKMKKKSGKCVFLDGKACRIYELRPVICRFYPFSMRKKNGSYVFDFAEDCPGIGMGCAVTEEQFERMAEKASTSFKTVRAADA